MACLAGLTLSSAPTFAQDHDHPDRPYPYCGSPDFKTLGEPHFFGSPNECGLNSNTAGPEYDPYLVYQIPVVWQIIYRSDGTGNISTGAINLQMQMLNIDFRPTGTQLGLDTKIEFVMASSDPQGNPTDGIVRTQNNTWFTDSGNYAASLGWDPSRYLNIYVMDLGGGLIGYVPALPQNGVAGTPDDGVRMTYSAIASSQYNHVLSHEIGHHLGLYHTFQGGNCVNSSCQTQGDLVCDTPPHPGPVWDCSATTGNCAGQTLPIHNYMNYQDVGCVYEFTPGQIRRMRCTLENWRPNMWDYKPVGTDYCAPAVANSTGLPGELTARGSAVAAENFMTLKVKNLPGGEFGFFLNGTNTGVIMNPGGSAGNLCLGGGSIGRYNDFTEIFLTTAAGTGELELDLTQTPTHTQPAPVMAGQTLNFQAWYRDTPLGTSNFTNATTVMFL